MCFYKIKSLELDTLGKLTEMHKCFSLSVMCNMLGDHRYFMFNL